jgi:hypothetical protein
MGFTFRLVGWLAMAVTGAFAALASDSGSTPVAGLTFAEARSLALTRNWDQLSAQRDVAIAEARRATAREWVNPNAVSL